MPPGAARVTEEPPEGWATALVVPTVRLYPGGSGEGPPQWATQSREVYLVNHGRCQGMARWVRDHRAKLVGDGDVVTVATALLRLHLSVWEWEPSLLDLTAGRPS